jgi:transcriptional regulator with XRE-family HTH domain
MSNTEHGTMADKQRAERIKKAILEYSTYEELAEKSGISVSTLVRIAAGKTEPKFGDVLKIAEVTGVNLYKIAYDSPEQTKRDATETDDLLQSADGYRDREVTEAFYHVVWNLRHLDKQDILSISRQVSALSSYSYSVKMRTVQDETIFLKAAARKGNREEYEKLIKKQKDEYGKTDKEIEELRRRYPLESAK